jgi:hypothetical protein
MDGYLLDLAHPDSFQKWTLVCAGILTVVYAVMRPFKKKRKDPLARTGTTSLAGQRDMEKQMTELLVELEQMSRQMTAQLQTRATKLELLIKEADEKIATLRRLAGATPAQVRMDIAPGMKTTEDSRHAEVYDLADQGRSPRQISQQLHRPYGEVELILALRGHQQAEAS